MEVEESSMLRSSGGARPFRDLDGCSCCDAAGAAVAVGSALQKLLLLSAMVDKDGVRVIQDIVKTQRMVSCCFMLQAVD
jgi:hypothetical protein